MADIQLSSQLFEDIQQAVQRQHPQAEPGLVMQYLAAVIGYMLASQRGMSATESDEFLEELFGFARHVHQDMVRRRPQQSPQTGQAFGYWEPPKEKA